MKQTMKQTFGDKFYSTLKYLNLDKIYKKTFFYGIAALTFITAWDIGVDKAVYEASRPVKNHVKSNLEQIMKKQEDKLGIKHNGRPSIFFQYGPIPITIAGETQLADGLYYPISDMMVLNIKYKRTHETNLTNVIAEFFSFGFVHEIDGTLHHELGHFYVDKQYESIGLNKVIYRIKDKRILASLRLVDEGIAEYFRNKMTDDIDDDFDDEDWPDDLEGFKEEEVLYEGGFHLVKPIIEKYGELGMQYLIFKPPMEDEIFDLPGYQKAALEELEIMSKKIKKN